MRIEVGERSTLDMGQFCGGELEAGGEGWMVQSIGNVIHMEGIQVQRSRVRWMASQGKTVTVAVAVMTMTMAMTMALTMTLTVAMVMVHQSEVSHARIGIWIMGDDQPMYRRNMRRRLCWSFSGLTLYQSMNSNVFIVVNLTERPKKKKRKN